MVKGTKSILDFFKDVVAIFRSIPKTEQSVKSVWGKHIKIWVERNSEYALLRRLIHAEGEDFEDVHEAFNQLMSEKGLRKASIMDHVKKFLVSNAIKGVSGAALAAIAALTGLGPLAYAIAALILLAGIIIY